MSSIKRVYVGLPEHLINKVYWVERSRRVNPLSHIEGGNDVVVEYHNKQVLGYDWVKIPSAYISEMFYKNYSDDDFEVMESAEQIQIVKNIISTMHVRVYKDDSEYNTASYEKVWDSENATDLPWNILENMEKQARRNKSLQSKAQREAFESSKAVKQQKPRRTDNDW